MSNEVHKQLWAVSKQLPGDYEPYGAQERLRRDCSHGRRFYSILDGTLGHDWGVCRNPASHRAGLLTYEHQGCPLFKPTTTIDHDRTVLAEPRSLIVAHTHASLNREELTQSTWCGCFACLRVYSVAEIVGWCDKGATAICPNCGIDAVLGDATSLPIDDDFLTAMKNYWFHRYKS